MAKMQGYCWPLSVAPGEDIEFRIATGSPRYGLTFVKFQNRDPAEVTPEVIRNSQELQEYPVSATLELPGQLQPAPDPDDLGCGTWDFSFRLEIPGDWDSNIYAAKCTEVDDPATQSLGETFYIVFVVNPVPERRNRLLVLANVTAWNAYNTYGGRSRYTTSGGVWKLSYLRPNPHTINLTIPDTADSPLVQLRYKVAETTRHLARGEMWVLSWLQQNNYACDVFTDLDWHDGIIDAQEYAGVILSTHPEYWSVQMMTNLKSYLAQGGNLVYLGADAIFDAVDLNEDLTVITVYGPVAPRTHLFRQPVIGMPESEVLGIGYKKQTAQRRGYTVKDASHRFMRGLANGQVIGTEGWCTPVGGVSLSEGAASGWEVDRQDDNSPTVTLLAEGNNADDGEDAAQMIYYDHPGGGFVFSTGSLTFGGSLVVDAQLQQIVRNALDEILS